MSSQNQSPFDALIQSKMEAIKANLAKEVLSEAINDPNTTLGDLLSLLKAKEAEPYRDLSLRSMLAYKAPTKATKATSGGSVRLKSENKDEFKLQILAAWDDAKEWQGTTDIAAKVNLTKPQVATLLKELLEAGEIEHNGKEKGGSAYRPAK